MKRLIFAAILLISPQVFAVGISVENYIATEIKMLETQIDQLHAAINLRRSESLTDTEIFERIGKPSFAAVENAMTASGLTLKQFYAYKDEHSEEIADWLAEHGQTAGDLEYLQSELDYLIEQYDQFINVTNGE